MLQQQIYHGMNKILPLLSKNHYLKFQINADLIEFACDTQWHGRMFQWTLRVVKNLPNQTWVQYRLHAFSNHCIYWNENEIILRHFVPKSLPLEY